MNIETKNKNYPWIIMMVLSILFIIWTIFVLTRGSEILPTAFKLAGSSQTTQDIELKALNFMDMTMLKPLWEELWIGIFGLFIANGLKRNKKYAWILGVFWGIMMVTNALIQGGYELIILGWSKVCLQTYVFLFLGVIAFFTVLSGRKELGEFTN